VATLLLALALTALQGSGEGPPTPRVFGPPAAEELEAHRRMLAVLEDVRAHTARQNAYLGDQPLRKLEKALEALDPATAHPKTLARFDYDIGQQLLRLGRTDEALERLRASHQRLEAFPRDDWPAFAARLAYDLGVAAMRKGETDNCVALHTAQSCLLPIEEKGVHREQAGSREAMRWLREALTSSPDPEVRLCARWLLNIAAMTVGEYPDGLSDEERIPPAVYASEAEFPRLVDVAPALGLNRFDLSGGAAIEDFDGDGLLDVLTSSWDTGTSLSLARNRGDGSFEDASAAAGLEGLYGGLNLLQADVDDDGWTDVLVLRGAWLYGARGQIPNSLLQNRGGRFLDVTARAGILEPSYPTQAAGFADYDLDGDLDLYVGAEANAQNLFAGQLHRNRGDGTFEDVAAAARVENVRYCKGVAWGDYDGDGDPDLYLSNLGGDNRLYRNRGEGTFEDVAPELGVTRPFDGFPTWFFDFDNDGALDLFAASYVQVDPSAGLRLAPVVASYLGLPFEAELSCLYRGDGQGGFTEVAGERNLKRLTMPMGANFGDLDGDGWLDLYLGTGYPEYDGLIPNVLYWNRGGTRFLDVTAAAGVGHLQKGHAVAFADLDQDGDLDLFEQMGGAYPGDAFGNVLYRNPGNANRWLELRLVGVKSARSAIGARIRLDLGTGEETRSLWRWVGTGGSFGASPLLQHVGLGTAERIERLEIHWPASGLTQTFTDVPLDARLEIVEGAETWRRLEAKPFRLGRD